MENSKKPSLVKLAPDHNYGPLQPNLVLFEQEMLTWPILKHRNFEFESIKEEWSLIYRGALDALTKIEPFETTISLMVNLQEKHLMLARRTWGYISLGEKSIINFTHDTRKSNCPYASLLDWVEMDSEEPYESEAEYDQDYARITRILTKWRVEDWIDFFHFKIRSQANFLNSKASKKEKDAKQLRLAAKTILDCFV